MASDAMTAAPLPHATPTTGDRAIAAAFAVRQVDLRVEMPILRDVFNRGFSMAIPPERFEWLYCNNPDGAATGWFVVAQRTGEIAGCTAVFPRRIQVRGLAKEVVAWNCGDFCILQKYRTGGAAVALRRAARRAVDGGAVPFLYAHPNDRMLQIHLRVGHQPMGTMIRLARPTRLRGGGVTGRVGTLGLRALRLDRLRGRNDGYRIESAVLPPELNDLFARVRARLGTAVVRDTTYLQWRFLDWPLYPHHFVLTTRGTELTGYLVYGIVNEQLQIKDWLGVDERAVRSLFSAAIDSAVSAHALSASVTLLDTHSDRRLIGSLGFGRRPETSTTVTYAPERLPWRAAVTNADAWYMTAGDRDV